MAAGPCSLSLGHGVGAGLPLGRERWAVVGLVARRRVSRRRRRPSARWCGDVRVPDEVWRLRGQGPLVAACGLAPSQIWPALRLGGDERRGPRPSTECVSSAGAMCGRPRWLGSCRRRGSGAVGAGPGVVELSGLLRAAVGRPAALLRRGSVSPADGVGAARICFAVVDGVRWSACVGGRPSPRWFAFALVPSFLVAPLRRRSE